MSGFEPTGWICSDWQFAQKFDTPSDWKNVCDELYGACQACIASSVNDAYDDYKTLLTLAREHRFNARSEA
jgi:hypothetical protein